MSLIKKYFWLVGTIHRAGLISLREINEKWVRNEELSDGLPIQRQTFIRWKEKISSLCGINIECTKGGEYKYFIENPDAMDQEALNSWILDTFETMDSLTAGLTVRKRIIVDEVPSSHEHLGDIVEAMKADKVLSVTYKSYTKSHPCTFPVEPYCLRMFRRRWYLLGYSRNDGRIRIYGLDRILALELTSETFKLPEDFDAQGFFATYFGVNLDSSVQEERIVLRAHKYNQHYLRSLPLHPSQKEIYSCDDYADFELHLRPGYEFVMELLRSGNMIEVMEPQSLRHTMHSWARDLWEMYKND